MSNYQAQYFDGNQYSLLTPNISKSTETFGRLTSDKFSTKEYADKAFYTFHIALDKTTPSYSINLSGQTLNTFLYLRYCVRNVNLNYISRISIKNGSTTIAEGGSYSGFHGSSLFLLTGDDLNGICQQGTNESYYVSKFIYLNKNTLLNTRLQLKNISEFSAINFICDFWVCLK